ncbi:hypothetical protein [Infirmifilum sp. SLHALR2]|nr:MAG: hypothetical protein B7L53_07905 [Thermofilum sp. NZ13]
MGKLTHLLVRLLVDAVQAYALALFLLTSILGVIELTLGFLAGNIGAALGIVLKYVLCMAHYAPLPSVMLFIMYVLNEDFIKLSASTKRTIIDILMILFLIVLGLTWYIGSYMCFRVTPGP